MQRMAKLSIIAILSTGLIVAIIIITSRGSNSVLNQDPPLPYILEYKKHIDLSLPPGDTALQANDTVLFLSSVFLDRPPREIVAYSLPLRKELWRVKAEAPPIQALEIGTGYLVATAVENGMAHLFCLSKNEGSVIWQRVFNGAEAAPAAKDTRLWVAWAQGIMEIDPESGKTLAQVASWNHKVRSASRLLAAYSVDGSARLVASTGREIYAYSETHTGWHLDWRFRAGKGFMGLYPVQWAPSKPFHVLALAHSSAYDIGPDGSTKWRLFNSDVNQSASPVRCDGDHFIYAFSNPLNGIYLVDRNGVLHSQGLPGGALKIGPIPLPLPANSPFGGLASADLVGDEADEIVVRSLNNLFVFDHKGRLLASGRLNRKKDMTRGLVKEMRQSPRYQPFIFDKRLYVATKTGIEEFVLRPRGGGL